MPVSDLFDPNDFKDPFKKIANGLFDIRKHSVSNFHLIGLIRIKSDYPFVNEHLQNQFAPCFDLDPDIVINSTKGKINITNSEQQFLFSLTLPSSIKYTGVAGILRAILYFLAYIFIIVFLYALYQNLKFNVRYKYFLLLAFIIDILLLRYLTFYFQIPRDLYASTLFSPNYFAFSVLFPSMGDLLANLILLFSIAFALHKSIRLETTSNNMLGLKRLLVGLLILFFDFFLFLP